MICLVTGDMGFVGGHLVKLLKSQGHEVHGFDLKRGQDFRDYETVRRELDLTRPDRIFHIGAQAFVPESFYDPERAVDVILKGSLNIFKAVHNLGLKTRIHVAGSSEEIGDTPFNEPPIDETATPNPLSPYAVAKLAMTHSALVYAESYNMNIVATRTFNHTGPGRGEEYAEGSWAKQVAEIETGKRKVLTHGNLESVRNYTDVRDIVKAYTLAIELPPGLYYVCSDQNVTMQTVLGTFTNLSTVDIPTKLDPQLLRPIDFSFKPPTADKFKKLTGWTPTISLEKTMGDILTEWREKCA